MKKTRLLGGLAVIALGFTAAAAAAAQQPTDRPAARTLRADTDGDGRLSQAEFVARRIERLRAADADSDGVVSADERRAALQARLTQHAATRFERLDADKDGVVSRAEFEAAQGRRGPRMRAHHGRRDGGRAGRAASPVTIADAEARMVRAFARLDADGDGYITSEERRAGRRPGHGARQASPSAPASE